MSDEPSIDDDAGAPPSSTGNAPSGFPLMITRAQRADLRALGHTDEAIGAMTPATAHDILRDTRRQAGTADR